ncbi:MAG: paraquat-inducible protein A [Burkholderiaceae bacterium]|nr:paraquat-inducible protein A [Burkholderiaceae bacterium]
MAGRPLICCPQCATVHQRVAIKPGALAACQRCLHVLYRQSAVGLDGWIALTIAALIVFGIANAFPIATLSIQGSTVQASLPGALWLTWQQGNWVLAIMTGLAGFWMPLTQLLFLLWGLLSIRSGRLPADFGIGMRFLYRLAPWSMVPVLMLGLLVAIVKFSGFAPLEPEPGLWGFAALTVLLTILSRFSAHRLWRYAEDAALVPVSGEMVNLQRPAAACSACGYVQNQSPSSSPKSCQRCGAHIRFRKPDTSSRVWALILAASIVYIPANVLPVMQVRTATGVSLHTIVGGVVELWHMGSWDLAIIVFVASVVVPMTKLLVLAALQINHRWRGPIIQRQRTRLYEAVEFIGQWSMLDVFVVLLMTALADFPGISQIVAGPGAASFGMVVVLTMLAAFSYDPRQGWDQDPTALCVKEFND